MSTVANDPKVAAAGATDRQFDPAKYDPTVIAAAKQQGWTGPEEYKGKGEWLPPDKFLEKGRELNPILRSRLAASDSEVNRLKNQVAQLEADGREFKKIATATAAREWSERYAALESQLAEAVNNADGAKVAQLTTQMQDHREAKPDTSAAATNQQVVAPERPQWMKEWVARNTWYDADPEANAMANTMGAIISKRTGKVGLELAEMVRAEMERAYPDMVGVDPRGSTVITPGVRKTPESSKAQTYDNMPDECKAACDRMVRLGWVAKQEDYVKTYYESQAQ